MLYMIIMRSFAGGRRQVLHCPYDRGNGMNEASLQVSSRRNLVIKVAAGPLVLHRQNTPDDQACFPYGRKYQIAVEPS